MRTGRRRLGLAGAGAGAATAVGYLLVVSGRVTVDLGLGRRTRPLGPIRRTLAAPPEIAFDVAAGLYLGKTPRAMQSKLRVIERGADMVLAEHFTSIGAGLVARTLETVTFERPDRMTFHLVRGPVPLVTETFEFAPSADGTDFTYTGEIGADLWAFGSWWAGTVGRRWERAVEASVTGIAAEAERRAVHRPPA